MDLLLDGTVKGTLIVLSALAVMRLLRGRSAALRHWVLAAALCGAAVVPLVRPLVPPVNLGLLPTAVTPSVSRVVAGGPSAQPRPRVLDSADREGPRHMTGESVDPAPRAFTARGLFAVWLAGAGLSLAVLAAGLARLRWLTARAPRVEHGRWVELTAEIAHEYGVRRRITLIQSTHPSLLVTWGLLRPRIVLPEGAGQWPADRIAIVLAHELAHIRRGDWAVQLGAEILRSIYWFNPLIWIGCRRLREESERACDDAVLRRGVDGPEYAWHLLHLARAFQRPPAAWFPAPAIARRSSLEQRIGAMLDPRIDRTPIHRRTCAAVAGGLLLMTIPLAALSAQDGPASLTGTVTAAGLPVRNAVLYITETQTITQRRVTTDQAGRYEALQLAPGLYRITAESPGIGRVELALGPGQEAVRDLVANVGGMGGSISVTDRDVPEDRRYFNFGDPFWNVPVTPEEREALEQWRDAQAVQGATSMRQVLPFYPPAMRDARRDGIVVLKGRIGTDGFLGGLEADGPLAFAEAALAAAREWQWEPARVHGTPVETPFDLTIHFQLAEQRGQP